MFARPSSPEATHLVILCVMFQPVSIEYSIGTSLSLPRTHGTLARRPSQAPRARVASRRRLHATARTRIITDRASGASPEAMPSRLTYMHVSQLLSMAPPIPSLAATPGVVGVRGWARWSGSASIEHPTDSRDDKDGKGGEEDDDELNEKGSAEALEPRVAEVRGH